MKLTTTRGEVALPEGFSFQIQQNHPFFSDEGSASVPATLPSSPQNNKVLEYPTDINRSRRFVKQLEAQLQTGTLTKRCRLVVASGHTFDGIDASLALDESEAYADIQKKNLRDILENTYFSVSGMTPWEVYKSSTRRDAVFFPVACDLDSSGSSNNVQMLNAPNTNKDNFVYAQRSITHGSGTVTVPEGYGLTPFLRLPELIAKVFSLCGYSIKTNVFATNDKLSRIVLLNQCADAMLSSTFSTTGWKVRYRDIVPSITVGDFITWLRDKFGAFVCCQEKEISILLFEDVCAAAPTINLTPYMSGDDEPTVNYPDPKALVLSMDTSLDGAAPAAETLEALRASHANCAEVTEAGDATGTGMFLVKPLAKYYFKNKDWSSLSLLGSDAFTYKRTTEVKDEEEKKCSDIYTPMVKQISASLYMPFIGDSLRRNIDIDDLDADAEQGIMICFAHWAAGSLQHWCGSQTCYLDDGSATLSAAYKLSPEQLHTNFWSAYEKMIINGAPEISCKLYMPVEKLLSMDKWKPVLLHGMKVFIKTLTYILDDSRMAEVDATFQTVPNYTDAVTIPTISFGTALKWRRAVEDDQSDLPSGPALDYEVVSTDGIQDYSASDAPSWKPSTLGQTALWRDRYFTYVETQYGYRTEYYGTHYYREYFVAVYDNA